MQHRQPAEKSRDGKVIDRKVARRLATGQSNIQDTELGMVALVVAIMVSAPSSVWRNGRRKSLPAGWWYVALLGAATVTGAGTSAREPYTDDDTRSLWGSALSSAGCCIRPPKVVGRNSGADGGPPHWGRRSLLFGSVMTSRWGPSS